MRARKCGKGMAGGGRICLLAAGISLGLCGCGGIGTGAGADTETELKEGQRTAQIRVISITGNELTYMEIETPAEEEIMTETSGDAIPEEEEVSRQPESAGSLDGMEADSERGRPETGQREDASMTDTDRNGRGQMPDVTRQEVFGGADAAQFGNGAGADTEGVNTIYLPVRITVHTDTGKETTFSILEAGDLLEARFETDENGEEVITEIWMLGE